MAKTPKQQPEPTKGEKLAALGERLEHDATYASSAERDRELTKLRGTINDLRAKYTEVCQQRDDIAKQAEFWAVANGEISIREYERLSKAKTDGTTVVIGCFDWHIEERVDPATVRNLNSYDLTEADKRVQRLWSKSLELIDFCRGLAPVRKIVLAVGGDLISGYIHEELMESAQLSPTQASLLVQDQLLGGIDLLCRETKLPMDVVTACGNHSRTTQKKRIATGYKNSYEWMSYQICARRCADLRLPTKWHISNGYHNVIDVEGHNLRVHHGDAVKFWGGSGGISIPVNKAVSLWDKAEPVYHDLFGHFHQFLSYWPRWTCSGCLIGYSPFAVEIKAEYQRPTQPFLVFDRSAGLTMAMPIFVT